MAVKKFPTVRSAFKSMTVAELAAGVILVPMDADRQYAVTDVWARATGSFGNAHVTIGDGHTTVITLNHEALTSAALVRAGATNATATNLLTALLVGHPIVIISDALETTATALQVQVDYVVSSVSETA